MPVDEMKAKRIQELTRRRQLAALDAAAGAWRDKDHPELKQGAAPWIRKLRRENERRFRKVTNHRHDHGG